MSTSFEQDIKPLFRESDREAMEWAFDLWSYDDVKEHSGEILRALEAGTMPCDGAWEPDQVDTYRSWATGDQAA
jgi:hypothetical protein